jgi:hypothetical protein
LAPRPGQTRARFTADSDHDAALHAQTAVLDIGRSVELTGHARTGTFSGNTATETKIGASGSPVAGSQFLANASIGGVFYRGTDFPESYRGSYFHADFGQRWIKNIVFDANHRPVQVRHFATDVRTVFLATHPNRRSALLHRYDDPRRAEDRLRAGRKSPAGGQSIGESGKWRVAAHGAIQQQRLA